MIAQMLQGQGVTVSDSAVQRLHMLGGIANLEIIADSRDPRLTNEALEAFDID